MNIEMIEQGLFQLTLLLWGGPLLILLIGTGVYLTFILRGMQFRYLKYALFQVFAPHKKDAEGDIGHFQALMTTLAGAIGTGSIVGISTAITIGGLGSLFWMWVTAIFGMATKYAESLLAVKYRVVDKNGEMVGGPMEYIERGLGWRSVSIFFSLAGCIAAITTGNLVQSNAIAEAVNSIWTVNPWVSGILIASIVSLVIIGGVKSIGRVAGVLVPFMALFYILGGLFILLLHYDQIPHALSLIFASAFKGQAAVGGFAGSSVMVAIQMGVSRSVFSSEAGFGISSIAAAAAKTDSAGRQGMITMTGALFSTLIVCSITGLVIAVTGFLGKPAANGEQLNGATLAIAAFSSVVSGGKYIVSIGLLLFAFSTILAWAYYGEKCCEYLFGEKSVFYYRIIYTLAIIPGAAINLSIVWFLADICNAFMVVPNLIALIALARVIKSETQEFLVLADAEAVTKA
ncbi:MAG: sodium:alanine symporter family protein [Chlamydiales bacterium]